MPAGPLDPDRLAVTEFATSFRGYDTDEVRALLVAVSEELRAASAREHDLREQLARAEAHLREVREAAAADAEKAIEQAVEAAAEEGRQQGREMVAEAQRVRERMLGDLARRRRHARQQVEQLMAGRERLLGAFDSARQTIEAATQEMRTSLPEARQAAEAAGRRFEHDDSDDTDEIEAVAALEGEIDAARIAGLPIIEPGDDPPGDDEGVGTVADEPSLLGERDVREMPPVELGAEFEEVRIVPVDTPVPAPSADGDDQRDVRDETEIDEIDEIDTGEIDTGEVDETDATEQVDETEQTGETDQTGETEQTGETDQADDTGETGETEQSEDADETGESTAIDESEAQAEPAADPEHLDDLFASLRAARADAVDDARTVLARDGQDAPDAADAAEADPAAPGPEDEPQPELDAGVEEGALAAPDPTAPALGRLDIDGVLVAATDSLASALKRVLAVEQNELLERLRGLRKNQSAADADVLGDGAALTGRFAAAAAEPLADVALVSMASTQPGPRARPPATEPLADEVAAGLVGPLRERLDRGLADAGTDGDEAAALVRATFREWKTQRIAALSADATRSAYHLGLLAGVARSQGLVWVVDDAEGACVECADNALAGPVRPGDRYPTGHRHPPAHDGCKCLLGLVPEEPTS